MLFLLCFCHLRHCGGKKGHQLDEQNSTLQSGVLVDMFPKGNRRTAKTWTRSQNQSSDGRSYLNLYHFLRKRWDRLSIVQNSRMQGNITAFRRILTKWIWWAQRKAAYAGISLANSLCPCVTILSGEAAFPAVILTTGIFWLILGDPAGHVL